MQSVELLLDDDARTSVLRQWQALADAGLPSQARHTGETNAPHVTIGLASAIVETAEVELASAAARLPFSLSLGAPLLFGAGRRVVLARMVVVTEELLALHRVVSRALATCPGQIEHLAVGRWVPHVTLARRMEPEMVAPALAALGESGAGTLSAEATTLRRWDGDAKQAWTVGS
ncbi:MAG: 2'-5' RNA ligase family protein [Ornithinimicrobium sp.]